MKKQTPISPDELQKFINLAKKGKKITDFDVMQCVAHFVLRQNRTKQTQNRYWKFYQNNFESIKDEIIIKYKTAHAYFESLRVSKSHKNWLSAMFQYSSCVHFLLLLDDVKFAKKAGNKEAVMRLRKHCSQLIHQVLLMEPDYNKSHWRGRTHDGQGFSESGQKSKKKRKRRGLRLLPVDWADMVTEKVKPEFQVVAMVQATTGCRTAELTSGVSITASDDDLFFEIKGAKINQGHGQVWRKFSINSNGSSALRHLFRKVNLAQMDPWNAESGLRIKLDRPDAYRKHISAAARAAGLDRISPICFRHQVASDLKSSGYSNEKIAMIMGHCSDLTSQKHYGLKHKGQYIKVDNVKAAQPVRIHKPHPKKPSHKPQKPGPQ